MALICISLMANYAENPFTGISSIYICFQVKGAFMPIAHFLVETGVWALFLLLHLDSSLYILDTSPMLDIWSANKSEVCLFILF